MMTIWRSSFPQAHTDDPYVVAQLLIDAAIIPLTGFLYSLEQNHDPEAWDNTETLEDGSPRSSGPDWDERAALRALPDLDPDVLSMIHDRFYPQIYRFVSYRIGDSGVAEDLTAEVFLRLLEAIHKGRGPRKSLRGWLMGTASNLTNDYFRLRYSVRHEPLSDQIETPQPGPAATAEAEEQQEAVRAALLDLTAEQQNVLALRFGAGYSVSETAEAMNKKINAVKQLQFRAIAALRRLLEVSNP